MNKSDWTFFKITVLAIMIFFGALYSAAWFANRHIQEEMDSGILQNQPPQVFCVVNLYNIIYVDTINPSSCHATRGVPFFGIVSDSFNYTPQQYFQDNYYSKGIFCMSQHDLGTLYCLNNRTRCMEIQGDICNIIEIPREFSK